MLKERNKKVRNIIRALAVIILFCSMTAVAMADTFQLYTEQSEIMAGEKLTVTVSLAQSLDGSYRNLQGQLQYDDAILTYCSHQLAEEYSAYMAADMPEKSCFTFSNTDFTDEGFKELRAGELVVVTFEVKKQATKGISETMLQLEVDLQDTQGLEETLTSALSIDIHSGQCQEIGENAGTSEPSLTEATVKRESTQSVHEASKKQNPMLIGAIVVILAAAAAGGTILSKRKRQNKE